MIDTFRRDGTPYPDSHAGLIEWCKDLENRDLKIVKQETLKNGIFVSTVWLGLDHGYGGKPLIFETMPFYKGESVDCVRYSTEAEALKGHVKMVKQWDKPKLFLEFEFLWKDIVARLKITYYRLKNLFK